ncbi:MAG: PEP-CTERM sorting domain-containing protein [Akkermansiaceae bacterium]
MEYTTKFACALAALGMISIASNASAALVAGQTMGIDHGADVAPTNNFNQFASGTSLMPTIDTTGSAITGITVTAAGFTAQNSDAVSRGDEDAVFNESNLTDWWGFPTGTTAMSLTIAGLDNALTYDLMIGAGFGGRDLQNVFTVDGQSQQVDSTSTNPFTDFTGLSTDGSGNLVINISSASEDVRVVSAWALTANAVPEPSSTALLGLGGLALILRRRKG